MERLSDPGDGLAWGQQESPNRPSLYPPLAPLAAAKLSLPHHGPTNSRLPCP